MIVQISSHRRSGTHALIDLIRENFPIRGKFFHLEDILDEWDTVPEDEIVIIKTHEPRRNAKLSQFVKRGMIEKHDADNLKNKILHIHVYRNPFDVLRSLYYFDITGNEPVYAIPENTDFYEFLKQKGVQDADKTENRVEFWCRTVRAWLINQNDVLPIHYNHVCKNKEYVIRQISRHIKIDAIRPKNITSTAIAKGITDKLGKENVWGKKEYKLFNEYADKDLLRYLNFPEINRNIIVTSRT